MIPIRFCKLLRTISCLLLLLALAAYGPTAEAAKQRAFEYEHKDLEEEKKRIGQFVTDGNYHAAINIALSCLNECRRNDNQPGVDDFLGVISAITDTLAEAFGSEEYLSKR